MRRLSLCLTAVSALSILGFCSVAAHADPIAAGTYTFTNVSDDGIPLMGDITFNASGFVISLDITLQAYNPEPTFTSVSSTGVSDGYDFAYTSGSNGQLVLYYSPTLSAGGDIVLCSSLANPCSGAQPSYMHLYNPNFSADVETGTLDPAVSATPEPSSLALLGTGLLGFCVLMRRRLLRG